MKFIHWFASIIALIIQSSKRIFRIYQNTDFRGKLIIAQYFTDYPDNGVYQVGKMKYDFNFNDAVQRQVFLNTYERHDIRILSRIIKPNWCCLDVGANVGFYTLFFASRGCKTYSFEPSPNLFEKLKLNVKLNELEDLCQLNQVGLSSKSGSTIFSTSLEKNSGWGRIGEWGKNNPRVEIQTFTLDDWVRDNNIDRIDFIKIDIEGHELEFLKGATKTMESKIIDRIFIEYSGFTWRDKGYTISSFADQIRACGFRDHFTNTKKYKYTDLGAAINLLFIREGVIHN